MKTAGHGRPTKLTPGLRDAICERIRVTGCSDTAACAASGIHPTTLTNWRVRGETGEQPFADFLAALTCARAEGEYSLLLKMRERGEEQKDWREIGWQLERSYRHIYGKVERHEVTGADGEPFKVYINSSPHDDV